VINTHSCGFVSAFLYKLLMVFQEGLVMVGQVDCHSSEELCRTFGATTESCVIYWEPLEQHPVGVTHRILGTDAKEIAKEVLSFLPEPSELDAEGFNVGADALLYPVGLEQ
jgi:hypothetical protein